jgi:hypothetical protein
METSQLKLPVALLWIMILSPLILFNIAAFQLLKGNDTLVAPFVITGIVIGVIAWIIILVHIIRNPIPNKTFWILSMFFVPLIAEIVYLIRRKTLLNMHAALK